MTAEAGDALAEMAAASAALPPPRLEKLTLCDFRGFPTAATIDLGGKNLLVYGENGSGKSSVFHALRHFFSLNPPAISNVKNVFTDPSDASFRVEVLFCGDAQPVAWTKERHPGRIGTTEPRVAEAALRKACLDYRALLDTNYAHGIARPNLFDIIVQRLLHDHPVVTAGGESRSISQLWTDVGNAMPIIYSSSLDPVHQASATFNAALRSALDVLHPWSTDLLKDVAGDRVKLGPFQFAGVTYQHKWLRKDRLIYGRSVFPTVTLWNHDVQEPQHFLNEALLSAIGLVLYLAGRLASVPVHGNRLKLLVLDDVLIGLDFENRIPILSLLDRHFTDWQIVILTHDRVWYDMAWQRYEAMGRWKWMKLFAGPGPVGQVNPTVFYPNGDIVQDAVAEANRHLQNNEISAAATAARRSFEWALKRFCEKKRVLVPYRIDKPENDSEVLLNAVERWTNEPGKPQRAVMAPLIASLRAYRAGVLNLQTHAGAPNPSRLEVEGAIHAVEHLRVINIA